MPIEIRELHIRMNVTAGGSGKGDQPGGSGGKGAEGGARGGDDELVARCVEQVMDILRNRMER